jgi:uncharacterized protein (DUF1800 family)
MRKALALLTLLTAVGCAPTQQVWNYPWQPLPAETTASRTPGKAITEAEASHLLRRTGFGVATPAEVDALKGLDYEGAVDNLLDGMRKTPKTAVPAWAWDEPIPNSRLNSRPLEERNEYKDTWNSRRHDIKQWWAGEMLATNSPLTEHMVLFWHNHFTSALKKVVFSPYMYAQNDLFRREAAGNFARMLHQVSKQPAMLIWLDNRDNNESHPNENFAREVLELFTMGEGHGYTEHDIREAARGLTGWRFDDYGVFKAVARNHDPYQKTLLGETGRFDGDEVLDVILRQKRTAEYIVERLWKEFVSYEPDRAQVARIADTFRRSGYEIRPALKALLMTPQFRAESARGTMVKSPVDLVVGSYRLLGQQPETLEKVEAALRRFGQDLMDPPNVKGWPGGMSWITASSLSVRQQFLMQIAKDTVVSAEKAAQKPQMIALTAPTPAGPGWNPLGPNAAATQKALLATAPVQALAANMPPDRRLRQLLLDPAFELK